MRTGHIALMLVMWAATAVAQETRPTTNPASDASTPRGALRLLNQAMGEGDTETIKRLLLAANPSEQKMVETQGQMAAALAGLRHAAIKAFGEDGARTIAGADEPAKNLERIDAADITINGNTATVTYRDQKEQPFVLKRVNGRWQVPVSELGKPVDQAALEQELADLAVQTDLVRQITREIEEGRYATADKARQTWRSRMIQAAASRPSTRPLEPDAQAVP